MSMRKKERYLELQPLPRVYNPQGVDFKSHLTHRSRGRAACGTSLNSNVSFFINHDAIPSGDICLKSLTWRLPQVGSLNCIGPQPKPILANPSGKTGALFYINRCQTTSLAGAMLSLKKERFYILARASVLKTAYQSACQAMC